VEYHPSDMTPEPPHLRPVPGPTNQSAATAEGRSTERWDGITRSRSRGGNARFLTDARGELDQIALSRAVAERHGLDHLDLTVYAVDMSAANLITNAAARRYDAVPVAFVGERHLLVAMADPANVLALDDIALMTGYEVRAVVASREDIIGLVSRLTRLDDVVASTAIEAEEDAAEIVDLRESADEAPVIKLVNQIIAQAAERGASDVHMSPDGTQMRVRFRIDGVLQDTTTVPRRMVNGVISRVKIMSELDIAEKRLPQDGRVGLTIDGRHIDLRVVTLPSVHGEGAVMRILDKAAVVMELDKLGFLEPERVRFQRAFHQAYGAVLVTGPTGSGKSTSLYAALGELNKPEKNIITIEDPVEYELSGITQIQVNTRAGLTFANGLRSIMRADPDVIMVGEIRDREAAQIAVEAALTGHLVLSTLHTNDAPTAITRLIEMGIEPFLVASAIDCVVGQRLARTLCAHCKARTILSAEVLRDSGFPARMDIEAYDPVGCSRCGNSGYKGRIGLYEVMTVTDEMRKLIIDRASADDIAASAMRSGMRRLREDGLEKVRMGRTSISEVARVTGTGVSEEY
jgi:type IV pilus assembly protein PilB